NSAGIYQQRYTSDGVATGGEIRVNTTTAGYQERCSVVALSDGGWVVTWQSADQDGSGSGIYQQCYTSAGVPSGGEIRVNTTTVDDQTYPVVAALSDGGWVVAWASNAEPFAAGWNISQQRYNAAGVAIGVETRVNTAYAANDQWMPQIIGLSDGGWLVTWESLGQDGSGWGIFQQRYDAAGNAIPVVLEDLPVISVVTDDQGGVQGELLEGAQTDDTSPSLSGTLSAELADGDTLQVFRNGVAVGMANVTGTSWNFQDSGLASGTYGYTVGVHHADGSDDPQSAPRTLTVSPAAAMLMMTDPGKDTQVITAHEISTLTASAEQGDGLRLEHDVLDFQSMGFSVNLREAHLSSKEEAQPWVIRIADVNDINGDGIHDLAIGLPKLDANGVDSGEMVVIYGRTAEQGAVEVDLNNLGAYGFKMEGRPGEQLGSFIQSADDQGAGGVANVKVAGTNASESGPGEVHLVYGQAGGVDLPDIDLDNLHH
ncbi:hypothetical protein ACIQUS_27250, partial [Pseudomonas sp. NPDC090755]|uniref:hypothetical protein n=1 Tax=Pseudomonas sp. NPDC090755 TaxID=3364481 RepID=UPI00383B2710